MSTGAGSTSDEEYVSFLYRRVLGREPDDAGRDAFVARLARGHARESILADFLQAPEFLRRVGDGGEAFPPGHFYSAIPSRQARELYVEHAPDASGIESVRGIDLRDDAQLEWLDRFAGLYGERPFPDDATPGFRYHYKNPAFGYGDGTSLYSMLRLLRPKRVIEIGSGYSSSMMLDVNDRFLDGGASLTFIEPYPKLLHSLIRDDDRGRHRIVESPVQDVAPDLVDTLEPNDILFIDSTHVSKLASDVNWLFFEWLPRVRPGVFVHLHDIFWPFEYPKKWVQEGRAWNELYLLRAFLMHNPDFQIEFFNDYLCRRHRSRLVASMPDYGKNGGGSIWIRRR